ncbi:MAG: patatin-like phospholipase family protein [Clostridia bacterium]|nr:patatin-like phospholipase family protein [Clostridia bacterium]MDD4685877.1 patatin-like phospholipase family protein [Clostridia bacterium]
MKFVRPLINRKKVKVGLALGGGGARGFAHLGAIKAFEEFGLKFDYVCGTSVGSLVGAFYAAGHSYEEIFKVARELDIKDIKTGRIAFIPSKTEGIENLLIENLGDIGIEELSIPFSSIAVDLVTTNEICITRGNLAKAVAGSCCVPGFFQPVQFDNMHLCDGGLKNTLPADIPKLFDCDYVVGIDVNKSRLYGTESTKLFDVISCSIRILMQSNVLKGYLCSNVLLKPETKRFKSTKTEGFLDMIEEGYREAIDNMPKIIKLFNSKAINRHKKSKLKEQLEKPFIY